MTSGGAIRLPSCIGFRSDRIRYEWNDERIPPFLRDIVVAAATERFVFSGRGTEITSIYRTEAENLALHSKSLTHCRWRAIDTTLLYDSLAFEDDLAQRINARFPTHVTGMPRVPPIRHGTAPHFHIQITVAEQAKYFREQKRKETI